MSNWWRQGLGYLARLLRVLLLRTRRRLAGRDQRGELLRDRSLIEDLAALLFREDPIGISLGPDDEYIGEAEAMAIWLPHAKDLDYVRRHVHEDFVQWFGADLAGQPERYDSIARDVIAIWQRHHPAAN